MAQVTAEVQRSIDGALQYLLDAWSGVPDAAMAIDSWDLIEQIDYVEEWGAKESLLDSLHGYAAKGEMSQEQRARYEALLRLVAEHRPTLERLRAE